MRFRVTMEVTVPDQWFYADEMEHVLVVENAMTDAVGDNLKGWRVDAANARESYEEETQS